MLNKAKENFSRIIDFQISATGLIAAMKRINDFLSTHEVQKEIISKLKDDISDVALTLNGSFSWGIDCNS